MAVVPPQHGWSKTIALALAASPSRWRCRLDTDFAQMRSRHTLPAKYGSHLLFRGSLFSCVDAASPTSRAACSRSTVPPRLWWHERSNCQGPAGPAVDAPDFPGVLSMTRPDSMRPSQRPHRHSAAETRLPRSPETAGIGLAQATAGPAGRSHAVAKAVQPAAGRVTLASLAPDAAISPGAEPRFVRLRRSHAVYTLGMPFTCRTIGPRAHSGMQSEDDQTMFPCPTPARRRRRL